jgi:hypothetical protein
VDDLLLRFAAPLVRLGLPYMVTGGAAAIVYGEPRLTNDLDVVLAMAPSDASRVAAAFAADDTYVPPTEVLELEAARRTNGHFTVIHGVSSLRADVYIAGDDPLHAWGLARRRTVRVGALDVSIAPPEYVIVRKLEYAAQGGGERHLRDIAKMLERRVTLIDATIIAEFAAARGLQAQWTSVVDRSTLPPDARRV